MEVPHPVCKTKPAMLEGEKKGKFVQDEVVKSLQASSRWALETPYGRNSAIGTFEGLKKDAGTYIVKRPFGCRGRMDFGNTEWKQAAQVRGYCRCPGKR